MKRILFVDDETQILEGLQRMLRPQRDVWEMAFAPGGEAALAMMEAAPFDVIVSDMRMPGMDGSTLLGIVCEQHPSVLRIILSGYTEVESTLRAIPFAHQFLMKPCESEMLRMAIERGTSLLDMLNSKMLASVVGAVRDLPSVPRTLTDLRSALSETEPSIDRVARIVETDVAIAAKILQLVNSAFFGVARNVSNIKTAVTYLGTDNLQYLVLSTEVVRIFSPKKPIPGFSIEKFQQHSQLTAAVAARISDAGKLQGAIVVAGLLHDIGKLVIADRAPEHFARALAGAAREKRPVFEIEEALIGVTHAEVGAYLLSLWGLPYPIVEAVAHHHHPERIPRDKWDMTTVIYLANLLAHEHGGETQNGAVPEHPAIDANLLAPLGGAGSLPEWRKMAEELASVPQGV